MRSEAFLLDHDHTGTEHLLIAIVEVNDDVTAPVLRRFGVSTETLRREVRALVTPGIDLDSEWTIVLRTPSPDDDEAAGQEVAPLPVASDREFTPRLMKCLMRLALLRPESWATITSGPNTCCWRSSGRGTASRSKHS